MPISLVKKSAAILEFGGSAGSFVVRRHDESGSETSTGLEVRYFLTYVGFDLSKGVNDQIFDLLAPVREVFEIEELEFDELMQRDIDDARVSEELIPYLLDTRSRQLIRFFPPVVVMLLPLDSTKKRPAPVYPPISSWVTPGKEYDLETIRSGAEGSESFVIEVPVQEGERVEHDLNRLKINPSKTRLVIVDGQHRAMALLALHRNQAPDGWTDSRRSPYKDYYAHWTPEVLEEFDLNGIQLPMIICTVPALHEDGDVVDYDLKKASRSIFLALNKNARKVSRSRNILLADDDLVAEFVREVLGEIKNRPSICDNEDGNLPIWAVELEQPHDRTRISTEAAVTAVNHLYYLIEHLCMRGSAYTHGIRNRSGVFSNRTRIQDFLHRLDALDELGDEVAAVTRRDSYSEESAIILRALFMDQYGTAIVRLLSHFPPTHAYACGFAASETEIGQHETPQLARVLYGGQGVANVLSEHVKNMGRRRGEEDPVATSTAAVEAVARLVHLQEKQELYANKARSQAVDILLAELPEPDRMKLSSEARQGVVNILRSCRTVAFQAALVCTYAELLDLWLLNQRELDPDLDFEVEASDLLEDYLASLSRLFKPTTLASLSDLLEILSGSALDLTTDPIGLQPTFNQSYQNVVLGGAELQPDAWPRLRYLLLELWRPKDEKLQKFVKEEVARCRGEVFAGAYRRLLLDKARDAGKAVEDLDAEARKEAFHKAFKRLERIVDVTSGEALSESDMSKAVSLVEQTESSLDG